MEISKELVKKYQMGGAAPAPAPAPAPGPQEGGAAPAPDAGGDPLMQLADLAMQALDGNDCAAAMSLAEGFLSLVQEAGAGAPPATEAPAEPVFRKGGKLVRRKK